MLKATLIGNVTRDPVSRQVGSHSVCSFSVASNTKVGGEEVTTFVNVSAWGRPGEVCQQYVKKGTKVALVGDLSLRNYDSQDGTRRTSLDMRADSMELLSPPASAAKQSAPTSPAASSKAPPTIDEDEDDDPPF